FEFNPLDLVCPPFRRYPNCSAEQFGVFIVSAQSYSRRCRSCGHGDDRVALPRLARKVIYIDQFTISSIGNSNDLFTARMASQCPLVALPRCPRVSARLPRAAPLAHAPLWNTVSTPRLGDQPLSHQHARGWRSAVGKTS